MRAEELLREPQRITKSIRMLSAEIEHVRSSLMPGGINYELDRIQGGFSGDRFAEAMAKIDALEREASALADKYYQLRCKTIPGMLDAITDQDGRDIIRLHDVLGLPMDIVADALYRSRSGLYMIRQKALSEMDACLDSMDSNNVI